MKLFFDIDVKDDNDRTKHILLDDAITDSLINNIFTKVSDILWKYYAIDYSIENLVVIDSGDHINIQDKHFYEEEDGLCIRKHS